MSDFNQYYSLSRDSQTPVFTRQRTKVLFLAAVLVRDGEGEDGAGELFVFHVVVDLVQDVTSLEDDSQVDRIVDEVLALRPYLVPHVDQTVLVIIKEGLHLLHSLLATET